jgi:hypothetical protein
MENSRKRSQWVLFRRERFRLFLFKKISQPLERGNGSGMLSGAPTIP